VLIEQSFRNSVAFVMVDMPQEDGGVARRPAGTAFFLALEEGGLTFMYAVTARHVLDEALRVGATGLFLRVRAGDEQRFMPEGFVDVPVTADQWVRHPHTDVAVARFIATGNATCWALPTTMLMPVPIGFDPYGPAPVGEGDDVFFVGMFSNYLGREMMLPIVRFGNIALMSYEAINVKLSNAPDAPITPIEAYLVEARSWGGHSGSPAWVYFPLTRDPSQALRIEDLRESHPKLLGLVHGHYSLDQEADFVGDSPATKSLAANSGIALVVPAHNIMEVLEGNDLTSERAEMIDRKAKGEPTPELDTPFAGERPDGEFERFEDLTRKLVQTPKRRE
jgi:hypothetical protein